MAEAFIFIEIYKMIANQAAEPLLCFWRTSTGTEMDIVVEGQGRLIPIEVKASSTPKPLMAKVFKSLRDNLGDKLADGYVVHLGDMTPPLAPRVTALPFTQL